ncbi:hypothetical protein HNO88_002507 [Novosphingobium chloroacetimidivorans]|uniref:DeoxyPurine in DNA protein A domain-containing protein n=1 Tax=Novosphingobium chloroacetimidivorans TaxID=1428314 RepID=A0A7W7NW51_9SPHN|nr:hypothetical protein [Novosphingobium chloroacetimidivorans]MBB4859178.1 hypothetical protein [Novosphingobium chloroacetimidivorans]
MSIEIIVGLPHLSDGPILRRARTMQVPALISANCLSRWRRHEGWRQWSGWRLASLANARGLRSLDLDSGGYVAMVTYGGIPWTVDDYMALASSFPFRRFASLDYCTEAGVARDREEVLDRLSRTIRANRDCRERTNDLGIEDRLMPVLQGRAPSDYERCADALAWSLASGKVVGVGSMCRRHIHGPDGLVAVFEHLDRILPDGVMLHGFGVKGTALSYLKGLEHRIASIDSQAYGVSARQDALERGVSKSDALVADHLERWTAAQRYRAAAPARATQSELALPPPEPSHNDRWEAAIATAREQIRSLIEEGQLDHDEVTASWVQE